MKRTLSLAVLLPWLWAPALTAQSSYRHPMSDHAGGSSGEAGQCLVSTGPTTAPEWASCGESGGASAWGDITGTLADQDDLHTVLQGLAEADHDHTLSDLAGSVTDAQVPDTITVDLATEASALAANGGNCTGNNFALGVSASGVAECAQPAFSNLSGAATDAQVPNDITVTLAATATALASNPADCATSTHFAVGVDAAGVATCEAIADADVPNNITIDLATLATTATTANAGDSATAFFSSGAIEVARGGTGAAPGGDDQVLVSSSSSAGAWATLPDCDGDATVLHYDTATNAFSCGDDDSGGGSSNTSYVRLAADSTLSTTTKTNLSGMAFTLTANTNYSWNCSLFTSANATTVGVQFAITFGGTVTSVRGMFQGPGATTTLLWLTDTSFQLDFNPTASQGAAAGMVVLSGTVEVSGTGGTLQFQHGSETATSTTVQRGSFCQLMAHAS